MGQNRGIFHGTGVYAETPGIQTPESNCCSLRSLAFRPVHAKGHLRLDSLSNYQHLEVHSNPAAASTTRAAGMPRLGEHGWNSGSPR